MKKILCWLISGSFLTLGCVLWGKAPDIRELEKSLSGELVEVVYHLQYDESGNPPAAVGVYCSSCADFHDRNLGHLLENRQLLRVMGYMVADDLVLASDVFVESSGVRKLTVQYNGNSSEAVIKKVYPEHGALLLQLQKTLPGTRPIKFEPELGGELFAYSRIMENGRWVARLRPFSREREVHFYAPDRYSSQVPGNSVIVNSQGRIAAVLANTNETIKKSSWNTPWSSWPGIDTQLFLHRKAELEKHLRQSVLPVTVYFKSWTLSRRERLQGVEPLRERYSCVFRMPDGKVIMPLLTTAKLTGLIDKVVIHAPGKNIPAVISGMLKDYSCMILELPEDAVLPPVAPRSVPLQEEFGMMIWSANITAYSKMVDIKVYSDILGGMITGLDGALCGVPLKDSAIADLIFDLRGGLLGVNVSVNAWQYNRRWPVIAAEELEKMLSDPACIRSRKLMGNIPDSAGFLGVEYQPLSRELAKSLNLEHLTRQGQEGLLITHVFENSPAAQLKLYPGDVLLKIIPPVGSPISLSGKKFAYPQERQFPWEQLDSIAEMYFAEIPEPWRGIKTPLNNLLTLLGIGQEVEFIGLHQGKLFRKKWQIKNAPTYFEIAPAYQSPSLGIEVRDLTFEVRHYFRMNRQAPGVIAGNISAGSPAATAGLKPFEIIVAVNDKLVFSIQDFQQAIRNVPELNLSVRRLGTNRVVTVRPKTGSLK